jgi:hypothetical protein
MKGHLRKISILENMRKGRDSVLVQKVFLCLSFSESVFIITNLTTEPKYSYVPPVCDTSVCFSWLSDFCDWRFSVVLISGP